MSRDYVDADNIRELIARGLVIELGVEVSSQAEEYLTQHFPIRPCSSIVDWDKVPHVRLQWMAASDTEAMTWARSTLAGKCSHGLLLYAVNQRCLIGSIEETIRHLQELVWAAPGPRILFGVNLDTERHVVFTPGIIEFNGIETLLGSVAM
jgi:hypothetical protein